MIDRQELIALFDQQNVGRSYLTQSEQDVRAFREELADKVLKLDSPPAPDVADSGTVFPELKPPEYAGGYHYPSGTSPGHSLHECNRRMCGPRL